MGDNGYNIYSNTRIHTGKMGEIAAKFINVIGLSGIVFGFLTNLNNELSVLLGMISFGWGMYKMLKEREDWLYRRSERRKHENENHTTHHKEEKKQQSK